jgi:putative hydrolase of the HAD superfamily
LDQAVNRALVLDFGGVISKTLFETHDLSEKALGLAPGTLEWRGPFDPDGDAAWRAMQAGEMSERDYWALRMRQTGALIGEEWTEFAEFVGRVRGADPAAVIRPEALAAIGKACDAGCRLAILSNELDLFYGADFRDRLPFLADFERDRRRHLYRHPQTRPSRLSACIDRWPRDSCRRSCVFVDDQMRNIRGARNPLRACRPWHFDVTADPRESYDQALDLQLQDIAEGSTP